ncbi:hypothetical protein GCM10023189_19540 [Nibrella saemangeumensis]|uniref:Uncharacterized protein n=1 Tax=Nibrella saemangeumensis TaxID=1084526 RepID=A0ABP8MPH9_9BACT
MLPEQVRLLLVQLLNQSWGDWLFDLGLNRLTNDECQQEAQAPKAPKRKEAPRRFGTEMRDT